ncbi:hypothetical protein SAMN04488040_0474 [Sulfitobacter marinus]|uniref:Uncharacterized protein n=1 Tax=Sulfitobacter marinus TaxID=394264 RepID=A0A1I6Q3C9_9RHOB|nr:hypothetical protein SAMN04488040_0474 [Sulfitobacter marinus]
MGGDLPETMRGGVVLAAALGFIVYAGQAAGIGWAQLYRWITVSKFPTTARRADRSSMCRMGM